MEQYKVEEGSRIGIVDLGSNSFRVLLGSYDGIKWNNERKQIWTTQLGRRASDGLLTEEAIARGIQALTEIQDVLDAYGATIRIGLATSAIRESGNGQDFLDKAKQVCPMEYRILTGEEEAAYGFKGATVYENPDFHYATIDVGGGSTEIALGDVGRVYLRNPILLVRSVCKRCLLKDRNVYGKKLFTCGMNYQLQGLLATLLALVAP